MRSGQLRIMSVSGELALIASLEMRLEKAGDNPGRMLEAFEHLESLVVLYDRNDCSVFSNRRYRDFLLAIGGEEAQGNMLSQPLTPKVLQEKY